MIVKIYGIGAAKRGSSAIIARKKKVAGRAYCSHSDMHTARFANDFFLNISFRQIINIIWNIE